MGFRITTGMLMNSYKYNLQNSTGTLADSREKVLTQRKFNSYAEDPAAAARAFRLRRSYTRTINQLDNTVDCYSKFNTAWNNLGGIVDNLVNPLDKVSAIRGDNGSAGESRRALAQVLRETADSIIHSLNSQLGDQFVFAGNDGMNVPFTWAADGKLLYRGVNVNAGKVKEPLAQDPWIKKLNEYKSAQQDVKLVDSDQNMKEWCDYILKVRDGVEGQPPNAPAVVDGSATDKWMKTYANQDVASGKMTREQADEWIAYYQNPNGLPRPEGQEPSWAEQIANTSAWDADADAQQWYAYYTHATDVKPADTVVCPADLNVEDMYANKDMDPSVSNDELDRWYNYYTRQEDPATGKLLNPDPPTADVPQWAEKIQDADGNDVWNPKYFDEFGTPKIAEIEKDFGTLDETGEAWIDYYKDQSDLAKLKKMSNEEMYIDLGMGAKENAPNDPILGSYFNNALCGINFIGYGVDKSDGFDDAGNYAVMLKELADVFDTWDESTDPQGYNPALAKEGSSAYGMTADELEAKAFRMLDKLKAGQEKITEEWVDMDARSKFLLTNKERLETQEKNINEEILDVEQIDLAQAITQFSWDQYCYNAALKVGNQLLSQSLIDYMR